MELIKTEVFSQNRVEYFIDGNDSVIIIRQKRDRSREWVSEGREYITAGTLKRIRKILIETNKIEVLNNLIKALTEDE